VPHQRAHVRSLLCFDLIWLHVNTISRPPSVGGLDLDSRSSGCARLGGGVGPPLGVVVEEVAVLVVLVRRHCHFPRFFGFPMSGIKRALSIRGKTKHATRVPSPPRPLHPSPGRSKSRHGRLALLPRSSCAAHGGCPRVNHSRVHLVHDRRPHEARDADQPFRSRRLNSCHCSLCLSRAKPREALWAHNLSIRGNASSNYRTPAVHRAGPPPRTDRNSDCWYSKKTKIRAIHQTGLASSKAINPEERSAISLPISDQRICSFQRCPDPCESEHLNNNEDLSE